MNVEIHVFTYQNKFLYLLFPGENHIKKILLSLRNSFFLYLMHGIELLITITHHYYQYLSNKSVVGCRCAPVIRLSFAYNIQHRHKHKLMKLNVFFSNCMPMIWNACLFSSKKYSINVNVLLCQLNSVFTFFS